MTGETYVGVWNGTHTRMMSALLRYYYCNNRRRYKSAKGKSVTYRIIADNIIVGPRVIEYCLTRRLLVARPSQVESASRRARHRCRISLVELSHPQSPRTETAPPPRKPVGPGHNPYRGSRVWQTVRGRFFAPVEDRRRNNRVVGIRPAIIIRTESTCVVRRRRSVSRGKGGRGSAILPYARRERECVYVCRAAE